MSFATVSAKLGKVQPATRSIAKEIYDAAAKAGHAPWYMWGMGSSSEHATGRALDLMVRNEAAGDFVRNYIWDNRKRLRLQHVIWEQHITSTVTQPGVRRKMADRGSVTENHMDHVHVLFFAGEYQPLTDNTPSPPPSSPKKSTLEVAKEVVRGEWGNGEDRLRRLKEAGYNYDAVQAEVERLLLNTTPIYVPKKSIRQIASEVIDGKWGNGDERVRRLTKAGYDAETIQAQVNRDLGATGRKTVNQIAEEVVEGKWGNGDARVHRLQRAGYDPKAVQAQVNRLMK